MIIRWRQLPRKTKRLTLSTLMAITVTAVHFTLFGEEDFRFQTPAAGSRADPPAPSAADAVFSQLQNMLDTVPGRTGCRQQHRMGGRCFACRTLASGMVVGQVDGPKPLCLDWLSNNCSVLSFGINNDFSFDDEMADLGCTVHAFDPTMDSPSHRRSERVFFHDVGIAATDGRLGGFPVVSLATAVSLARMTTGDIDYLKLDVEGSEWEVLLAGAGGGHLGRVRQLAVEFHLFRLTPTLTDGIGIQETYVSPKVTTGSALRFVAAIRSLQSAGFQLIHTDRGRACHNYTNGCLSFIYETVWANTRLIHSIGDRDMGTLSSQTL